MQPPTTITTPAKDGTSDLCPVINQPLPPARVSLVSGGYCLKTGLQLPASAFEHRSLGWCWFRKAPPARPGAAPRSYIDATPYGGGHVFPHGGPGAVVISETAEPNLSRTLLDLRTGEVYVRRPLGCLTNPAKETP